MDMYAVRLHEFGPAANLAYERVPAPSPGRGQVRIDAEAVGVHLIETTLRSGRAVGPHLAPDLPVVLGGEVAGAVGELGPGVPSSWLGRRVVAPLASYGGYAERAVTETGALHEIPGIMTAETAVAMVTTGATTLGVLDAADVLPGDMALVTSAAGGVGALLVQALRGRGAVVVGVAGGPEKARRAAELGADLAADHHDPTWPDTVRTALDEASRQVADLGVADDHPEWPEVIRAALAGSVQQVAEPGARVAHHDPGRRDAVGAAAGGAAGRPRRRVSPDGTGRRVGLDVVFDGVGGTVGRRAFELLAPGGMFLLHGWSSGTATRLTTDDIIGHAATVVWALGPRLLRHAGSLRELQARALRAAADGALVPLVARYPLSRAADAHADLENRRTTGKVVLIP
ncbi:zinc-binding dehydrogenase [Actinomadura sp. DC4]|uniref:zinc-binding dehydrogenase n=1 Tax=Actinomadura sp. DC4 TaxID=3055069 RepID=UPI0025B25C11|nr:zinc-binding dehydrogenase [Actinomadura sp. DC4]MDN3352015.1 zinc-binding dehydrogenase [Actinomadura sp. DC4]